jgi:hypothetical protein
MNEVDDIAPQDITTAQAMELTQKYRLVQD